MGCPPHNLADNLLQAIRLRQPLLRALPFLLVQLIAAGFVVHIYRIEDEGFLRLYVLAVAGFLVNIFLRVEWRLPFFALLSVAAAFLVFDPAETAWLIGTGLSLIAICHLPFPMRARVLILLLVGALLASARAGFIASPWSSQVWPILGSMFMFRLVLYIRAVAAGSVQGGPWAAISYFFMFPNLIFPLFPVIDYQTFRRNYFDRDEIATYQQGLMWIARGLMHLILYRFVYHRVVNDPNDVANLGDLVQHMLGIFLLYLRVSGTFHLVVGLLHLFGFRLPETHKLYYLSHNIVELWRRINIYWKDFMMTVVFYPVYFRVKKLGTAKSLAIATGTVFAATWVLHSYQWFWLRGGFPVTLPDILFWGILGVCVTIGAVRELKRSGPSVQRAAGWNLKSGVKTLATFSFFCVLWCLWSSESVWQWVWLLGSAANVDGKGLLLIGLLSAILVLLGGYNWDSQSGGPKWLLALQRPAVRTVGTLSILIVLMHPDLQKVFPAGVPKQLSALQMTGLNVHDAELRHRGYYEQLDVRGQLAAQSAERAKGLRRGDWQRFESTGILNPRGDILEHDLLPSRSVIWNGMRFSTNRWGMRDQEYSLEKPPRTLRIALLGPSVTMGNGVGDGEPFESIVEARLNRELPLAGFERFEILNFSIDAYCLAQQAILLNERVLEFAPDVVIATNYTQEKAMTRRYLQRVVQKEISVPYQGLRELISAAGLEKAVAGTYPIPFESWRAAARGIGLNPRLPHAEIQARVHGVAGEVSAWSIRTLAATARGAGARVGMLVLNGVNEETITEVPDEAVLREAAVKVFNLLAVYPESQKAELRVAPWDTHPNALAHHLIADRLYPELVAYLQAEFDNR